MIARSPSPEQSALLASISCVAAPPRTVDISLLNWSLLLRLADRHGVTPLLASWVATHGDLTSAGPVTASLREAARTIACQNLRAVVELRDVIVLLSQNGVKAIPFKGPLLSAQAYGELAKRQFEDLDLLVRPADVKPACDSLAAAGYRLRHFHDWSEVEFVSQLDHHVGVEANGKLPVEVHWDVMPPIERTAVITSEAWASTDRIVVAGFEFRCLPLDNLVIALCLHAGRHTWRRLGWIADLAHLLSRSAVCPRTLLSRAASIGATRRVLLGLHLAREYCGLTLPVEMEDSLHGDPSILVLARKIDRLMWEDPPHVISHTERLMRDTEMADTTFAAARLVFSRIVVPHITDYRAVRLPRSLRFGYVAVRAARLGYKVITRTQ